MKTVCRSIVNDNKKLVCQVVVQHILLQYWGEVPNIILAQCHHHPCLGIRMLDDEEGFIHKVLKFSQVLGVVDEDSFNFRSPSALPPKQC